jgi:hypothetical protein
MGGDKTGEASRRLNFFLFIRQGASSCLLTKKTAIHLMVNGFSSFVGVRGLPPLRGVLLKMGATVEAFTTPFGVARLFRLSRG